MTALHIATWLGPPVIGAVVAIALVFMRMRRGATRREASRTAVALATGAAWAGGIALASVGSILAASADGSLAAGLSPVVPLYVLAAQLWAGMAGVAAASVAVTLLGKSGLIAQTVIGETVTEPGNR